MTPDGRKLGPLLATCLVAGSMIGSGIYLLPASLGAIGSISLLGWLGALAAALVFAGMFAWFGALRPDGGGFLANVEEAFGPLTAFVAGGLYWVQGLLGNVAIALAVTGYAGSLMPGLLGRIGVSGFTILTLWIFVMINLLGPRPVAWLEGATLLLGLLPIMLAATIGWLYFDPQVFAASWNVSGMAPGEVVPQAIVLVLWAFLGLESACVASAMVENPRRNVPIATLGGVLLAAAIYVAASTALTGILPAAELALSTAPFADAATVILGASVGAMVALCAALKASGTLGGWILLTSESARLAYAVDVPAAERTDRRPRPLNFLISGVLMTLVVLATADPSISAQFARMANAVVIVMICVYAIVGAALVRLYGGVGAERPWPARMLGVAAVLLSVAIMMTQDRFTLAFTFVVVAATIAARYLLAIVRKTPLTGEQMR
ncbi:amino acid permease [Blastomonas fulva]|jgi:arginine:agmatine antiporter|uniref:amino acid permease n=1 Tax=Blastomonas fulva TaxID=1550728 RepID=UPI003D2E9CE4